MAASHVMSTGLQVSLAEECEYNTGLAKLPVATADSSVDEVIAWNFSGTGHSIGHFGNVVYCLGTHLIPDIVRTEG